MAARMRVSATECDTAYSVTPLSWRVSLGRPVALRTESFNSAALNKTPTEVWTTPQK